MVSRGFRNDNGNRIPRASSREKGIVITKVMASGGWIRQTLREAGVHPETENWQRRPGIEVARELVALAGTVETLPPTRTNDLASYASKIERFQIAPPSASIA